MADGLPEYEDPPVVETVLGVEFAPIAGWSVIHFGLFRETVKAEFPDFEELPAVVSSARYSDDARAADEQSGEFGSVSPYVRCLFVDHANDRLIQVQRDRFMYNWRREVNKNYPRYLNNVRPNFIEQWRRFKGFLEEQRLEGPRVRRSEVTYVNHFERGKEWSSFDDLSKLMTFWIDPRDKQARNPIPTPRFLPTPEYADIDIRYRINDQDHLHVEVRRAERHKDGAEILQTTLTARLSPVGGDDEAILATFDTGREWIVRGFTELTTPEMHLRWRRTR